MKRQARREALAAARTERSCGSVTKLSAVIVRVEMRDSGGFCIDNSTTVDTVEFDCDPTGLDGRAIFCKSEVSKTCESLEDFWAYEYSYWGLVAGL